MQCSSRPNLVDVLLIELFAEEVGVCPWSDLPRVLELEDRSGVKLGRAAAEPVVVNIVVIKRN